MTTATDKGNGAASATVRRMDAEPVEQISKLPADMAIIKLENEQMFAMAAARPRDHAAILDDIKTQLRTYKTFAQTAMYAKPVGKDRDTGKMKYATGLSVRAAEAIAEAYGYNRCRIDVEDIDGGDKVCLTASFVDYQKCRTWQTSTVVSKSYKKFNGQTVRHDDDRFYNVVVKAEASKAIREAILRSVPPGLRSDLEECVNEQLDQFLDESTQQKLVAKFSQKGVTQADLERVIDKRLASFDQDDRRQLLQIWNAIEQGETTVSAVFGDDAAGEPAPLKRPQAKQPDAKPEAPKADAAPKPAPDASPTMQAILDIVAGLEKKTVYHPSILRSIGIDPKTPATDSVNADVLATATALKSFVDGLASDKPKDADSWKSAIEFVKGATSK